jgi:hypothetical protein
MLARQILFLSVCLMSFFIKSIFYLNIKKKGKKGAKNVLDGDHSWSYWTPKDERVGR